MPKPKTHESEPFKPKHGDVCQVEILDGQPRPARNGPGRPALPIKVREPRSSRVLKTGDHVTFSTYYKRRVADGSIRLHPLPAAEASSAE